MSKKTKRSQKHTSKYGIEPPPGSQKRTPKRQRTKLWRMSQSVPNGSTVTYNYDNLDLTYATVRVTRYSAR